MPLPHDLRPQVEGLAKEVDRLLDSKSPSGVGDQLTAIVATSVVLQCEQLQRLAHTLHRIDGTLEALLTEFRNVTTQKSPVKSVRVLDARNVG